MDIEVTRTYLQLARPEDLSPARANDARVRIDRVAECPRRLAAISTARSDDSITGSTDYPGPMMRSAHIMRVRRLRCG